MVVTVSALFQPVSASPTPSLIHDLNGKLGVGVRPSDSFGLNPDQLAMGLRSVMNNVKSLTNNTTSILISAHEDSSPVIPAQPMELQGENELEGSASSVSSPDTEGPGE